MEDEKIGGEESGDAMTGDEEKMEGEAMTDDEKMVDEQGEAMIGEEVVIDTSNFKFSKTQLTAKAGETLTVKLTNSEGTHNFVIDELNVISKTIQTGQTDTVTIKIPEDATSGSEYAFYCSIGNHRAMGMEGVLTVENGV